MRRAHERLRPSSASTDERSEKRIPTARQGAPIQADTRAVMESRFGHDFADVRVHADAEADKGAQALDARAFTLGEDVYFRAGEEDYSDAEGLHLLAHELAHTIDDPSPPMVSDWSELAISQPGDASEGRAERDAQRVVSGEPATEVGAAGAGGVPTVHRFSLGGMLGGLDLSKQFGGIQAGAGGLLGGLGGGIGGLLGGGIPDLPKIADPLGISGGIGGLLSGAMGLGGSLSKALGPIGVGMGAPNLGGLFDQGLGTLGGLAGSVLGGAGDSGPPFALPEHEAKGGFGDLLEELPKE